MAQSVTVEIKEKIQKIQISTKDLHNTTNFVFLTYHYTENFDNIMAKHYPNLISFSQK